MRGGEFAISWEKRGVKRDEGRLSPRLSLSGMSGPGKGPYPGSESAGMFAACPPFGRLGEGDRWAETG
jgi:hypothetical protein